MLKPHFVRDYRRLVSHLVATDPDYESAMARAVGGHYAAMGTAERALLERAGLSETSYVVDVGAGSGRLAYALRDLQGLRYLGTDVVPDLLAFAAGKCGRPDWRFQVTETIAIPEANEAADFVVFFSVFTHLTRKECLRYLREACRVLKPGGRIVLSYLDRHRPDHVKTAGGTIRQLVTRLRGCGTMNSLTESRELMSWAAKFRLGVQFVTERHDLGQSVCLFQKADAPKRTRSPRELSKSPAVSQPSAA